MWRSLERASALKKRLRKGVPVSMCWATLNDPAAVEIVADTGFDIAIIDSEHAPWHPIALQNALLAFKGSTTVPVFRTLSEDDAQIKLALDIGFDGILVPNIKSGDMAKSVVAASSYPPDGTRGFGPRRASSYGRDSGYRDEANDAILVMAQIEHRDAVDAADEIMSTSGIDAVIIGPNDLSGSFGRLGELNDPDVARAIDETIAAGQRTETPVGYGVPVPKNEFKKLRHKGVQLISLAADVEVLVAGLSVSLAEFEGWMEDSLADQKV